MRAGGALLAILALSAPGCDGDVLIVVGNGTLLVGVVTRGPVTPVCLPAVPCSAPFAAGFLVTRDGREVARFDSGADGRFSVALPSGGEFRVVPEPDAPILDPPSQARGVAVRAGEVNEVRLEFDTGIR
jgi:hypothetical protein